MLFAPALPIGGAYCRGSEMHRGPSKYALGVGRNDCMMGGPKLMLLTKWPSMTSRWRKSAPPRRASSTSPASLEKSAARMEARIIGCGELKGLVSIGDHHRGIG